MPFVIARVNVPVSRAKELKLKERLGKAIEFVPGKDENCLLVQVDDNCHLFLAGSDEEPIAYVEVSIFGNESHMGYGAFTVVVTEAFRDVLDVRPDHVYLRFSDIGAWSVAGRYIDRRMFGSI